MNMFRVRGRDERVHIFRLEKPGVYLHFSRMSALELERQEEDHEYTREEVITWIKTQRRAPEPISQAEIDQVKASMAKSYDGRASVEDEWPTGTVIIKCERCNNPIVGEPHKYGFWTRLDQTCYDKLKLNNNWGIDQWRERHPRG